MPPTAFNPAPQVESAVVRLTPHQEKRYDDVPTEDLVQLVAMAFAMRRKTLANNLKKLISATQLTQMDINPSLRPEQISIEDYIRLAKFVSNTCKIQRT